MLVLVSACTSHAAVPGGWFVDMPVVEVVNDRKDVPRAPKLRAAHMNREHLDTQFFNPIDRALGVPQETRALGINALDEVPDSTWYSNRRPLTSEQIRRGATTVGSPEQHVPWTILSLKAGGTSIGFIIADARGEKFILKFDLREYPELETATGVIVNRLLWACGYNVTEEHVVYFRRDDLGLAPDAKFKNRGRALPLTQGEVTRQLAQVSVESDGRIRGIASRLIDGTPLGGHPASGVRPDDLNDRIPHERRRDLRGAKSIFAWLDHVDAKEGNTLDVWAADPKNPKHHYVIHYLIDFGKSFGAMATINRNLRSGYEYAYDFWALLDSLTSFGTRVRLWERRVEPGLRGVGLFDITTFDPGSWKPNTPSYLPFRTADRIDEFWGAKRVIQFTRAQLRAAVDAGRMSDPRAADHLVDTLVERQRATARHSFARVNPLDRFEVAPTGTGRALCFDDLAVGHRLADSTSTRYVVTIHNRRGRITGSYMLRPKGARSCTANLVLGGYTIVRLKTRRTGLSLSTYVHISRGRVIGVWRE